MALEIYLKNVNFVRIADEWAFACVQIKSNQFIDILHAGGRITMSQ